MLLIVAGLLAFSACKKESDPVPDCVTYNSGVIKVYNGFNEPFDLTLNGSRWGTLPAYQTIYLNQVSGTYTVKFKETNYIILPTEREKVITLNQCDTVSLVFN